MPQQVPITTMSENPQSTSDNNNGSIQIFNDDNIGQKLKDDLNKGENFLTYENSPEANDLSSKFEDTEHGAASKNNSVATTIEKKQIETSTNDNSCLGSVHSNTTSTNVLLPSPSVLSASSSALETSGKRPTTKLNGLKNRIIQRPPPLVLDKVSNFYDIETSNNYTQATRTNAAANSGDAEFDKLDGQGAKRKLKPARIQSPDARADERSCATTVTASGNSANQKFWASLNENASRNKALADARAAVNNAGSQSHREINGEASCSNLNKGATSSADTFGADLIIRHRKSNGHISSSRVVSSMATRRQEQPKENFKLPQACTSESEEHSVSSSLTGRHNLFNAKLRVRDVLNSSGEQDDGTTHSEHGGSVGGGGNLIGVDNSTSPATSTVIPQNFDDIPLSAGSSRPRSNNPFLDLDDEDDGFVSDSRVVSRQQANSFHKRPASFIAATSTDKAEGVSERLANEFSVPERQKLKNQFDRLSLADKQNNQTLNSDAPIMSYTSNLSQGSIVVSQNPSIPKNSEHDHHSNVNMFQPIPRRSTNDSMGLSLCETSGSRNRMSEQSISIDSQSAISQPLPNPTMQLPHWTDAIYDLNNAILDANSIAGGAEVGQFIYIVESGDIVLELDQVKVSGFTLIEFNELVESKQFHLLKAVQTKHSFGLTHDLKLYLNQSFPKNSSDKNLQNLIRENIYRRTIPCTTRMPRPGEEDKVDYHFLTKDQFVELNNRGMLLECGVYAGHFYGTLKPLCDLNILSIYQSLNPAQPEDGLQHIWDVSHPAVGQVDRKDSNPSMQTQASTNPLYENHESIQLNIRKQSSVELSQSQTTEKISSETMHCEQRNEKESTDAAANFNQSETLPPGWEQVIDQTHGTYYIDHNTRRTQYERPYEVELTKGSMGFGFTLVEADNGMLLVRSIIQGGPAHMNGSIKPGDILISAVGISVSGLQHTDVARLFSTFAVGDRVRLTFTRSNFILDNIVPDEYLFSNGTNGDLAIAFNPNSYQPMTMTSTQSPHIVVNQEFELINLTLRRGEQGFGFTISDSMAGQKVRKIQNGESCAGLKQGDILVSMNGENITSMTHKKVVERLKSCPSGEDVRLTVKRKKRFRSKTPMAMHTDEAANGEYSLDSTPQRNCKTPSLDGLMLIRPVNHDSERLAQVSRPLFHNQPLDLQHQQSISHPLPPTHRTIDTVQQSAVNFREDYSMTGLPIPNAVIPNSQLPLDDPIYGTHIKSQYFVPSGENIYGLQAPINRPTHESSRNLYLPNNQAGFGRSNSIHSDQAERDDFSNSAQASESCLTLGQNNNMYDRDSIHRYNNFVPDDTYISAQTFQTQPNYQLQSSEIAPSAEYCHLPLYSNSEIINGDYAPNPTLPAKPIMSYPVTQSSYLIPNNYQDNYYANNEEIAAIQNVQYGRSFMQQSRQIFGPANDTTLSYDLQDDNDDYEYHHIDLERENSDSNWGIRLIGGAEVERAISIGSIVFGGAASKNGQLKSGDEIISINGFNVIGATHQHVVELISTCTNRALLVVRRKRFAEACDVVLTRNMDEGFGFVIISNGNCALIGRIIEGSPADRCKQLHVRDRIIAVNGRCITSNMRHPQIVSMIKECGSTLRLRIIPVDCYTVELIKNAQNDNFGFSIRGGSEYDGTPLYILRVAPNGLARDLLNVGDQILEINNIPTIGMTHQQAATIIKYSDPIVKLKLRRNYVTPASLLVDSPRELQKFNQVTAEMMAVNQNSTPNQNQVGALATCEPGNCVAPTSSVGLASISSEFDSANLNQVVTVSAGQLQSPSQPKSLQLTTPSLEHEQTNQNQQTASSSSSLPHGNQSQPLYAA